MVIATVSKAFTKVFGSRNERLVKSYNRRVQQINALEPEVRKLTDPQLTAKTGELRDRVQKGENIKDLLPEALAVAREAMDRAVGIRNIFNPEHHFDPNRLPANARHLYDEVKAKGEGLAVDPVLGGDSGGAQWWLQVEIPVELYEAVRQIQPESRWPLRARPFDVQLIGAMVLHEGKIAEMKTGEGKTIVAPLACYLAILEGLQCHVVTTNDYLVQVGRDWVFPFYYRLGLTVGAIHPQHVQHPMLKQQAYLCNTVYGTNSEFGFDYLRDNMKLSTQEQVQKKRDFCIVDEIDSILIDEARTPLIISGPAHDDAPRYDMADELARHLMTKQREWDVANEKVERLKLQIKGLEGDIKTGRDKAKIAAQKEELRKLERQLPEAEASRDRFTQYYEVERDKKAAHLTHDGVAEAQRVANVGSFYVGDNMDVPHLLENSLRAHAVYKRDKDYVVRDGEVIIVDEFTGRLMIGRQWSNGLHQAVEAKEKVKIKEETQTLATVTIQNFFKLYKRLAGMTGTAITESTEFHEIYKLEVVAIPTNRPITRIDRDDLIFLTEKDKWSAILDEIKRLHDWGRPVLVGTTSVDKSETLSNMLMKRHGIQHEVLNAKVDQAEREGNLVASAGQLGAVMIATNMAGRGTDIKLGAVDRAALIEHWKRRNLVPREASAEMSDVQLLDLAYRHTAIVTLGIKKGDAQTLSDDELKLRLLRHWVQQDAFIDEKKAQKMSMEDCLATLDGLPDYKRHRLEVFANVEQMGGLHIVGTERHESRRIDNQLRGRAGRQGDRGSSRFFISLEDDLMKLFMPQSMATVLSKMGMKEGDAIEHGMVSRSVERAQRKVEERNYEIRKSLLEYDEVMEHQRNTFYGTRQAVLEGRSIDTLIFDYIADAVEDAAETYLGEDYVRDQVAEWTKNTLDVSVDPSRVQLDSIDDLQALVRREARGEIEATIDVTLGEYMSNDVPPEEWDLRGLQGWATSRFGVNLNQSQLRQMNFHDVRRLLTDAAIEQLGKQDLSGLEKFLVPNYGAQELATWARTKFGIELSAEELAELSVEQAAEKILAQARDRYRKREVSVPVEHAMETVFGQAQQGDQEQAVQYLLAFVRQRYGLEWTAEDAVGKSGQQIHDELIAQAEAWLAENGQLQQQVSAKVKELGSDHAKLAEWIESRFGRKVAASELAEAEDLEAKVIEVGRGVIRQEMTQLERAVLLQILDQAWKDHLYGMDQLKDSIGLRGYAEKDPRIEYKREGANHFREMQHNVRDRVTEMIFRARFAPNLRPRSVYANQQAQHAAPKAAAATAAQPATAAAVGSQGSAEQRRDLEAAERAGAGGADGDGGPRFMSRKQRRAVEARERKPDKGAQPFKKR